MAIFPEYVGPQISGEYLVMDWSAVAVSVSVSPKAEAVLKHVIILSSPLLSAHMALGHWLMCKEWS